LETPAAALHAARSDWRLAVRVITYRSVECAIDSFVPYKNPGMDGIFPTLLQEGREVFIPYLVWIYHACLSTGYVPAIWRQVKVVFIPKPRRNSYSGPRDFRPISLTSLLLKTMERLLDRYLREEALAQCHCIQTNMLIKLGNRWKRHFVSSWYTLRRRLINKRQLWVFSLIWKGRLITLAMTDCS
jgi:hypothetical protein